MTNTIKALLISLFFLSVSACNFKKTTDLTASGNVKLFDPNDLNDLLESAKWNRQQRIQSLDAFKAAMKTSYVGYEVKKQLIGLSGDEIFDLCYKMNEAAPEKIFSFEAIELFKRCVALFQDSHLGVSASIISAQITTLIAETTLINGKLIITNIRPNLISLLEKQMGFQKDELMQLLKIGTEVIEVDGKSISESIQELLPIINSSSDNAAKIRASRYLFTRTEKYPTKTSVKIKLKNYPNVIEMPWIIHKAGKSLESKTYLKNQNFLLGSELSADADLMGWYGFDFSQMIYNDKTEAKDIKQFVDPSTGELILRTALVSLNDGNFSSNSQKQICYLQITSFSVDEDGSGDYQLVDTNDANGLQTNILPYLDQYLKSCDSDNVPLVLDLKENGGGNSQFARRLFYLFENQKGADLFYGSSMVADLGNLPVFLSQVSSISQTAININTDIFYNAVLEAKKLNSRETPWMLRRELGAIYSSFKGKVVVLTTSDCVSACDGTVRRFKLTGRGIIIGDQTRGTGFGFSSTGNAESRFRDPFNAYEVGIPNHAFQMYIAQPEDPVKVGPFSKIIMLPKSKIPFMENNPTIPDIKYDFTANDFPDYSDVKKQLRKVLESASN